MLREMFCLERTSPGFTGSFGEKAWFESTKYCINTKFYNSSRLNIRIAVKSWKKKNELYIVLPGTENHSSYRQFLGASLPSEETAMQ